MNAACVVLSMLVLAVAAAVLVDEVAPPGAP